MSFLNLTGAISLFLNICLGLPLFRNRDEVGTGSLTGTPRKTPVLWRQHLWARIMSPVIGNTSAGVSVTQSKSPELRWNSKGPLGVESSFSTTESVASVFTSAGVPFDFHFPLPV